MILLVDHRRDHHPRPLRQHHRARPLGRRQFTGNHLAFDQGSPLLLIQAGHGEGHGARHRRQQMIHQVGRQLVLPGPGQFAMKRVSRPRTGEADAR